MNELPILNFPLMALGLIWGLILGAIYFGGLWLTIRHLPGSKQPALLTFGSFLGRSAVCLFGFYLMSSNGLGGLASSLAGFILMKIALIRRLGPHANRHQTRSVD